MGKASTREIPSQRIRVLLIPAAEEQPCQTILVDYSAAALSEAIGGGLLDDIYYGHLGPHASGPIQSRPAGRFCFYADEDRVAKQLPVNSRAGVLAARLGCIGDLRSIPLSGDVLITGATLTGDDADVPGEVIAAARRGGLLPASAPAPRAYNRSRG